MEALHYSWTPSPWVDSIGWSLECLSLLYFRFGKSLWLQAKIHQPGGKRVVEINILDLL